MTIFMSCSTSSTVMPSARISASLAMKLSVSTGFMPDTGSSSSRSLGFAASATASSSRRWSPYGSALPSSFARAARPTNARICAPPPRVPLLPRDGRQAEQDRERASGSSAGAGRSGCSRARCARRTRWSSERCAPAPARRSGAASARSAAPRGTRSRPPLGARYPVIALKAVVLPAPFGPISDRTSPSRTSRLRSSMAARPPKRIAEPLDREQRGGRHGAASPCRGVVPEPLPPVAERPARCPRAGSTRPAPSARRRRSTAPRAGSRTTRRVSGSSPKMSPPTTGPASVPLPPVTTMITMVTV